MTVERKGKNSKKMNLNRGHINIELLDGNTLAMEVQKNVEICEVFKNVCTQLNINERDYFGLAKLVAQEYVFIDSKKKISDVFKLPKRSSSHEYDEKRAFTLYFRVQFFVINASVLRERNTRHHYYLQIRENFLNYQHQMTDEQIFTVVAYALQSDHDDICVNFDPRLYFPASYIEEKGSEYLTTNIPKIHDILKGICTNETKMLFIKDLSTSPINHNLHIYRLKLRKNDKTVRCIAICPDGIQIYEIINGNKNLKTSFTWSDIEKLTFEKKKFSIKTITIGRKFIYHTESEFMARYLLTQCQLTHQFYVGLQRRIKELSTMAEEDKKSRERFVTESTFNNSHARRSLSYRSIRSISSQVKPACLTAPIPQIIGTPGEDGYTCSAFMAYEPYISRHSSVCGDGYNTPTSSSYVSGGEYSSPYVSPSSTSTEPFSLPLNPRGRLSRHLSDRVVSKLTVSRGITQPEINDPMTSEYRNNQLMRHYSERMTSSRYYEPVIQLLPNPKVLKPRPLSIEITESCDPFSQTDEIIIDTPPVRKETEYKTEELKRNSAERLNKKSLPTIKCQNERRASLQIINQLMQCSEKSKVTLDINDNHIPSTDLKIPDFLLETQINNDMLDISKAHCIDTLRSPMHCPLHGGSGHIIVESFKNHSLPMLSGLLADVSLCACPKSENLFPNSNESIVRSPVLAAFDRLLNKNELNMASQLQESMRNNSIKRRAISDPKTSFIIPPMHSLTVE